MISFPKNSLYFVIRVWIEPREIKDAPVTWRGVVEVMNADPQEGVAETRIAFHSFDQMLEFIVDHLKILGIPPDELKPN